MLQNNCVYNPGGSSYTGLSSERPTFRLTQSWTWCNTDRCISSQTRPVVMRATNSSVQPGGRIWTASEDPGSARGHRRGRMRRNGSDVHSGGSPSKPGWQRRHDGSSWAQAMRTVQAGISVASTRGGEVWVAAGTYKEGVVLQSYAYLYGGFAGTRACGTPELDCKCHGCLTAAAWVASFVRRQGTASRQWHRRLYDPKRQRDQWRGYTAPARRRSPIIRSRQTLATGYTLASLRRRSRTTRSPQTAQAALAGGYSVPRPELSISDNKITRNSSHVAGYTLSRTPVGYATMTSQQTRRTRRRSVLLRLFGRDLRQRSHGHVATYGGGLYCNTLRHLPQSPTTPSRRTPRAAWVAELYYYKLVRSDLQQHDCGKHITRRRRDILLAVLSASDLNNIIASNSSGVYCFSGSDSRCSGTTACTTQAATTIPA